jgi:phosphoribosylamine-glycine ligase
MLRYNIPTSEFRIFNKYEISKAFLDRMPESFEEEEVDGQVDTPLGPITNVKRSLKHAIIMTTMRQDSDRLVPYVAVPHTKQQAHANAKWALNPELDCPDQQCLMVEKRLDGTQITITTFSDGKYINSLPPVEVTEGKTEFGASKPFDGDKGCIAPVQNLSPEPLKEIDVTILRPTLGALIENSECYFSKKSGRLADKI